MLACCAGHAAAQSSYSLLRPELDDPSNPQRFQRPGSVAKQKSTAAKRATPAFQSAFGAASTAFDSSGTRKRKTKAGQTPKAPSSTNSRTPTVDPLPSRYGSPAANALAPLNLAVPRPASGVARKGASPYFVAPEFAPDSPPVRRRPVPDPTPFDPIGVQFGAFVIKPAIELSGGYDTNPARVPIATPSLYSVVAPELKFNSNWSRHEFTGELRGSYSTYRDLPSQNRPNFDGKLSGRIDVTRDTRINLEATTVIATDNPGSPNIQAGLARLPVYATWGGSAALGQRFNRFDIAAKGGAERTVYQDSTFTDGTTASNEDRNYNRYFTLLRGTYELTPAVKPFVEVGADRRVHDLTQDAFGMQRDSSGYTIKGGSTFELTRIVTGEAAVGWLVRDYKDPTLASLSGLTLDGSLTWLVSALTTFKMTATTRADESRLAGVSGVFTREVALQVEHAFRLWLVGTLKFVAGYDDYVGSPRQDDRYAASAAITYKLTRELHLKSELRREWLRSNVTGVDYNANIVLLGLRLQR
jgi:hypothetical protein